MNELIIKNKQVASIEFDKEKALNDANEIMKKYEGLQIQEEDLKDAKKELATLRKVGKEINAQALALDKELTKPVKTFRNDVKEIIKVIQNGIDHIDAQVKEFESKAKSQRKEDILSWEEYKLISEYIEFDDSWLLKKYDDDTLKELFNSHNEQLNTYISTIKMTANTLNLKPEFYIDKLKTLPYTQVIERMNEDAKNLTDKPEEIKEVVSMSTERLTITRVITGTREQLKAVKQYAIKIGCEYRGE